MSEHYRALRLERFADSFRTGANIVSLPIAEPARTLIDERRVSRDWKNWTEQRPAERMTNADRPRRHRDRRIRIITLPR